MLQQLRTAAVMLLALTIVTGAIYPLVVTGIGQVVFPHQANGSLIVVDGKPVGSELIGQQFTRPEYFWGRLSATGYNATASSGSNYGPLASGLYDAVQGRVDALDASGSATTDIPVDLVTASGSGIDPHISPAAAEFQVPRVAAARNLSEDDVRELVKQFTENRTFGVLGEPRVNVLRLNLALDGNSNE